MVESEGVWSSRCVDCLLLVEEPDFEDSLQMTVLAEWLRWFVSARGTDCAEKINFVAVKKKALGGTRTPNPQIRSLMRYPLRH